MLFFHKLTSLSVLSSFNSISLHFKSLFFFFFIILFLGAYQPNYAQNWNISLSEGGQQTESANATTFDAEGNLYVIGSFEGKITLSDKKTVLESKGGKDIFLAKYNPTGQLVWVKRAGGTGSDIGYGIAMNSKNEVCITGHFSFKANFEKTTLYNKTVFSSIFIAQYDSQGNLKWVDELVESEISEQGSEGRGIACDENDNIFVTGAMYIKQDNENELGEKNGLNMFVAKYSSYGGTWEKLIHVGGKLNDTGYGITINKNNIYVTGIYRGKMKLFGREMGLDSYSTSGFLIAFDTDLNAKWIRDFGGRAEYNHAWAVGTDSEGNIYMTGRIEGIANLDNAAFIPLENQIFFLQNTTKKAI